MAEIHRYRCDICLTVIDFDAITPQTAWYKAGLRQPGQADPQQSITDVCNLCAPLLHNILVANKVSAALQGLRDRLVSLGG